MTPAIGMTALIGKIATMFKELDEYSLLRYRHVNWAEGVWSKWVVAEAATWQAQWKRYNEIIFETKTLYTQEEANV
jgi:hypothetical protein